MAMPSDPTNPPSFKVLVETRRRLGGPSGTLVVYSTALALYPSASCQRLNHLPDELHQTTPKVNWVRQPFFPPWLNRAIDFRPDGTETTIRLRLTGSARRGVRDVLTAAGFQVVDVTSRSILFGP
jgi:hypothetical protein